MKELYQIRCNTSLMRIAAIILAAGRSSRMGTHKALLPLGTLTVLEQVVRVFLAAGVSEIRIVTGFDRCALIPVISQLAVQEIVNPNFEDGMYSSVQIGVASLDPRCHGFFIHPVDIPAISPETISSLMNVPGFDSTHIVTPEYEGRRGHPPLFGESFRDLLLTTTHSSGLAGFLNAHTDAIITVQVKDPGIRMNMNTPADYHQIQGMISRILPE
jgi:CTP:molybdopterin cytidylyltransferase MocA